MDLPAGFSHGSPNPRDFWDWFLGLWCFSSCWTTRISWCSGETLGMLGIRSCLGKMGSQEGAAPSKGSKPWKKEIFKIRIPMGEFSHSSNLLFFQLFHQEMEFNDHQTHPWTPQSSLFPSKNSLKYMGSKTWRELNQNCDLQIFIFVSFWGGKFGFGFLWILLWFVAALLGFFYLKILFLYIRNYSGLICVL